MVVTTVIHSIVQIAQRTAACLDFGEQKFRIHFRHCLDKSLNAVQSPSIGIAHDKRFMNSSKNNQKIFVAA